MKRLFTILFVSAFLFSCQAQKGNVVTAAEFNTAIKSEKVQLLDVRTKEEYATAHIANALQANWNNNAEFEKRAASLSKDKPVYVYCLSGGRSAAAATNLLGKGFTVVELKGGINEWKNNNLPTEGTNLTEAEMKLSDFEKLITSNDNVLVDFGAKWCPPCIKMNPILDSLQKQIPTLKIVKIDLDKDKEICKKYSITELPVFHFYKNNALVKEVKGEMKIEEILKIIKK